MTTIKILGQEPIENVKKSDVTRKSCARVDELTAKLKAAESVNEWISVEDRLPTELDGNKVLIYRNMNDSQKALQISIHDSSMVKYCDNNTFWMPLPTNPI